METGPLYFKQKEWAVRPEDDKEVIVETYIVDAEDDTYVYVKIDGERPGYIPKWAEKATYESPYKIRITKREFDEWISD